MRNLFLILMCFITSAAAYETDQFSTPPAPLADVGEDFTHYIFQEIEQTIEQVNNRQHLLEKIVRSEKEMLIENAHETEIDIAIRLKLTREQIALKHLYHQTLSKDGVIELLANKIGGELAWQDQRDGVFNIGLSIFPYKNKLKHGKPILYLPGKLSTIYSFSGFHRFLSSSYFVFCSTMQAYGVYFGVDKLGHMFNQGFQYFELYKKQLAKGVNDQAAIKTAIDFGVNSEFKLFGKLVDGVYSNADLAANMAGFYFYKNLFESIELNGKHYPALLQFSNEGKLSFNPHYQANNHTFMDKFFTDHLNEALNPSHIEKMQLRIIRKAINNRCERILPFYQLHSQQQALDKEDSMKLLYQLPYGHNSDNNLKISDICF